jgi:hypothetical protein
VHQYHSVKASFRQVLAESRYRDVKWTGPSMDARVSAFPAGTTTILRLYPSAAAPRVAHSPPTIRPLGQRTAAWSIPSERSYRAGSQHAQRLLLILLLDQRLDVFSRFDKVNHIVREILRPHTRPGRSLIEKASDIRLQATAVRLRLLPELRSFALVSSGRFLMERLAMLRISSVLLAMMTARNHFASKPLQHRSLQPINYR